MPDHNPDEHEHEHEHELLADHDIFHGAHPDDASINIEIEDDDDRQIVAELLGIRKRRRRLTPEAVALVAQHRLMNVADLRNLPPIEWFVEDLLPLAPQTMLHGAGGTHKSFLMLDWMLCAATARSWHGIALRPGKVLYIAGEGVRGLPKRIKAWCDGNEVDPLTLDNIHFLADPINLHKLDNEKLLGYWQGFFDAEQYDYVVIDTLHTASTGAEENSSTEMGQVIRNAVMMVGEHVSIFYVHHTTKSGGGHRGSSALRDDVDVAIMLAPVDGVELLDQLSADKIRDGERFKPVNIHFDIAGTPGDRSLYVTAAVINAPKNEIAKGPSAIDKCCEAITEHGLDYQHGQLRIRDELRDLDLGYNFGPGTVGASLKRLRGVEQQVHDMRVGRTEIEVETTTNDDRPTDPS